MEYIKDKCILESSGIYNNTKYTENTNTLRYTYLSFIYFYLSYNLTTHENYK